MNLTTYQWLCILGVPTLVVGLIGYVIKRVVATGKETQAIALGVQAILRMWLRREYERCCAQGYAKINERDDFENAWAQYHALGANGVMDDIHKKFLALPTRGDDE